jgi:DNA invertase Pin-like site-specific DNA recombinase
MNYLDTEGVALKNLQKSIDTSTATGQLVFHVFSALTEFERNLIWKLTQAGLSAARAIGRLGGRPLIKSSCD